MLFDQMPGPIPALEQIGVPITRPIEVGPGDIIPGLLPRQGQLVVAGQTDIGKSLIALEICSSLITGKPLWGHLEPTFQARKILYVLGEHYNEVIQRLWQKTELPMTDQVFILGPEQLIYDKWLVANGKPNILALDKFKKWADGVDLVVFDPLAAFISGVDAENDNIQMRLLLDMMSAVTQPNGASCLVLAHQGKPALGKDGKEYSRTTYAIRGASGIEDAATNIFYMGAATGSSVAAHNLPEGSKVFCLTRRKYKGTAPEHHLLLRDKQTLTHTLLGNRPYVQIQKIDTKAKVDRLLTSNPEMSVTKAVQMVASYENVHESTVWRHLKGTETNG
jgi:RecA-family ATPase